jgi:hypothetical protein
VAGNQDTLVPLDAEVAAGCFEGWNQIPCDYISYLGRHAPPANLWCLICNALGFAIKNIVKTSAREQMTGQLWKSCSLLGLMIGSVLGQTPGTPPSPSSSAQIIRVEIGSSWGLSGASDQTVIELGSIRWEIHPSYTLKKQIPAMKRKCRISTQDWRDLQKSVAARVLAAFTGCTGCPACVDQPETWTAVEFSDGTKKFVRYSFSAPPPAIAALLRKIDAIRAKCPSQPIHEVATSN